MILFSTILKINEGLTYKDDPRYMVTIRKTPSDNRAGNNNAALINKIMI